MAIGVVLVRGIRHGAEGVLVALAIGCAIAGYTLVDKDGLRHAAALPYLELVMTPVGLVALPVVAARRGMRVLPVQLRVERSAHCCGVLRRLRTRARGAPARPRARSRGGAR